MLNMLSDCSYSYYQVYAFPRLAAADENVRRKFEIVFTITQSLVVRSTTLHYLTLKGSKEARTADSSRVPSTSAKTIILIYIQHYTAMILRICVLFYLVMVYTIFTLMFCKNVQATLFMD